MPSLNPLILTWLHLQEVHVQKGKKSLQGQQAPPLTD